MHVQLLRNYSISFSLQYMLYSSLSPMCFCVFSSCSVFESVSLVVSYNSPIWSHFGSVSERCSRRGSSRQHRAHHLAARTFCPSQMTETVHIPEPLSLALLRAHQARVDRLKRWHAGLVCWALGYFFFFYPHFSVLSACVRGHWWHIKPGWRGLLYSSPVKRQWLCSRGDRKLHLRFGVQCCNEESMHGSNRVLSWISFYTRRRWSHVEIHIFHSF